MLYKSIAFTLFLLISINSFICCRDINFEIKSIKINHRYIDKVGFQKPINVFSKNNDIQIELFPIPQDSVSYKYILINFERDTILVSAPIIRYMALPAGRYDLNVFAIKNNKQIAKSQFNFNVKKSPTETWWFYPMLAFYALLMIGGGFYLFFLYNFRQKMKLQKMRNKLAADLHDEIGSSLSSIAMSSNFIQNKITDNSPEVNQILSQMKTDSEETVNTIRDTVWALNPDNDSLETLIEKVHSFALQILVNKGVKLNFENRIKVNKSLNLNLDTRKNLFLIAKEAINNIAKHADAKEASIIFDYKNEMILINISDDGMGFNNKENFEGNGLKNFKKRAEESFIDIKIESEIGKGTKVRLVLPVI